MPVELDTDYGSSFFIKLPDVFPLLSVYIAAFWHLLKFSIFKDPSHTPPAPRGFKQEHPAPDTSMCPLSRCPVLLWTYMLVWHEVILLLFIMAIIQWDTNEDWLICSLRWRERFLVQLNHSGFIIMLRIAVEFSQVSVDVTQINISLSI